MNHSGGGWGRGVVVVPGGGQSQVLDHAALRFSASAGIYIAACHERHVVLVFHFFVYFIRDSTVAAFDELIIRGTNANSVSFLLEF